MRRHTRETRDSHQRRSPDRRADSAGRRSFPLGPRAPAQRGQEREDHDDSGKGDDRERTQRASTLLSSSRPGPDPANARAREQAEPEIADDQAEPEIADDHAGPVSGTRRSARGLAGSRDRGEQGEQRQADDPHGDAGSGMTQDARRLRRRGVSPGARPGPAGWPRGRSAARARSAARPRPAARRGPAAAGTAELAGFPHRHEPGCRPAGQPYGPSPTAEARLRPPESIRSLLVPLRSMPTPIMQHDPR